MKTAQKAFWPLLLVLSWIFAGFSVASAGGFGPAQGSSGGGGSGGATTSAWSDVLANGATSGPNSPIVADGQSLQIGATAYKASLFAGSTNGLQVTASNDSTSATRFMAQVSGTFSDGGTNSTTTAEGLRLAPTINYTGGTKSGHYEALSILATETSLPTGTSYLIRASSGSAGTTDKFGVTNLGQVFAGVAASSAWSASPGLVLDTESNLAGVSWTNVEYNTATPSAGPVIAIARARGSVGSPTATQSGDSLGGFWFGGYGTSFGYPVQINAIAAEGFDSTHSGADLRFSTLPVGAAGAVTERWWMTSTGHWIGASGLVMGWTSGAAGSTADTGLSRDAAGVLDVGTGLAGSTAGSMKLTNITQAGTGQHTWGTGGSPSASSPHILGPTDVNTFITAGTPTSSGVGRALTLAGGIANGSANAGGAINFVSTLAGAGTTPITILTLANTGNLSWPSGLGSIIHLTGPSDQDFFFRFTSGRNLRLWNGGNNGLTVDTNGAVALTKTISAYQGTATQGLGVPAIFVSQRVTAQTAAKASLATYTPSADGSFEIVANVLVTTATSHSFTVTCTYTDESNTARTLTLPFVLVAGSAITNTVVNTNGAVPYIGVPLRIRAKASTAITIQSTGTFTTVTYNIEADIKQVS